MEKLTIVKVGGQLVENPESLTEVINRFSQIKGKKVLVHGGGRSATKMAQRLQLETHLVDGRRITDQPMLEVVIMVYGGLVNKTIVAEMQARGMNALGLTGADLNFMQSIQRPVTTIDYGFVGDVTEVNPELLLLLINRNVIPVLAPLTYDKQGQLLNTNADTIAAEAAIAFSKNYQTELVFCFEKPGVLANPDEDGSVIHHLCLPAYQKMKATGVVHTGMIPKLDNSFRALEKGVSQIRICDIKGLAQGGTLLKG